MKAENSLDRYLAKKAKEENSKPARSASVFGLVTTITFLAFFGIGAFYIIQRKPFDSPEEMGISAKPFGQVVQGTEAPIDRVTKPAPAPKASVSVPSTTVEAKAVAPPEPTSLQALTLSETSPAQPKSIWAKSYIGRKAPEFEVEGWITDKPNLEGKFVLIDFWATWCPPCRAETPQLNAFQEKFRDKLVVIGVSDEQVGKVKDYTQRHIRYYSAVDRSRKMYKQYEIEGIPHLVLIDPEGVVRWEGFPQEATDLTEEDVAAIVSPTASDRSNEGFGATPILRVNSEMHTAAIRRMAVDAAETTLATASDDKTVKLWELKAESDTFGSLKCTIRLPGDAGSSLGKAYSVALSPDGTLLAAGGWFTDSGDEAIYLYDTETGAMRQRIGGLSGAVLHLAFSPDGRFLVACANRGIQVHAVSDGTKIFADTDYGGDPSYGADWSPVTSDNPDASPSFVTTCYDGKLRFYTVDGKSDSAETTRFRRAVVAKIARSKDRRPVSCAVSPDGRQVAVGYEKSTRVDVINFSPSSTSPTWSVSYAFSPDTSGIDYGDLSLVEWSRDGTRLLAGGRSDDLIVWEDAGRGERKIWRGSPDTVMGLVSMSGGRTLIGTGGPSLAMLDAHGERIPGGERLGEVVDFRGHRGDQRPLFVSYDGALVRFPFDYSGTEWGAFSASDLRFFASGSPEAAATRPATLRHPRFRVDNWADRDDPALNGRPIHLDHHEMTHSLAIAPDTAEASGKGRFLLGTAWNVLCFDGSGVEIWRQSVPAEAWAVNVSGDGRLAVAAFGDGSIRWFRMRDGEPLLALFPHNPRDQESKIENQDSRDWVLWAPDTGHFRSSPDGERLIGWQLNRGKDANPDFHSGDPLQSEMRDQHGILQRVLKEARPAREILADLVTKGEMARPRPLSEILSGAISSASSNQGGVARENGGRSIR
ncbi:MAG: redoxin domain-containing protein [Verrucomicrobiales bacterium]|nr:redoxin domain-containing protein [Verrucomicrobiales bacterium]